MALLDPVAVVTLGQIRPAAADDCHPKQELGWEYSPVSGIA